MLFARRDEEMIFLAMSGCGSVLQIGLLVMVILYYLSLMKALQACSPANRTMEPGLVWLNFVPLLNLVWCFMTVAAVGNSLKREYQARGMDQGGGYGKPVGFTLYALNLVVTPIIIIGVAVGFFIAREESEREGMMIIMVTAGIGGLIGLVQLALFITYWVQVVGHTRRLTQDRGDDRRRDRYDDDDRPRRDDGRGREDNRRPDYDDDYRPR